MGRRHRLWAVVINCQTGQTRKRCCGTYATPCLGEMVHGKVQASGGRQSSEAKGVMWNRGSRRLVVDAGGECSGVVLL